MSDLDAKLKLIAEQLAKGVAPANETVRTFLSWYGASRRGYRVSKYIKWRLKEHGLRTEPDFEYAYIDNYISFEKGATDSSDEAFSIDPTHRIARLASANHPPVSVKPDNTLQQAVTLMLTKDFSQLPVMTSTRELKGVLSWKAIGSRLALKRPCSNAQDCMEPAHEVGIGESLFSAIRIVADYDYVLVRANDQQICGIITASDLTEQFQKLAEPFLLVGEYIRLLEKDKNWAKVKLESDRVEFVKQLHEIREIRNEVMHFDPDGLDEGDLKKLREFAPFLKRLRDVGAA